MSIQYNIQVSIKDGQLYVRTDKMHYIFSIQETNIIRKMFEVEKDYKKV